VYLCINLHVYVECINQPKVLVEVTSTSVCPNRLATGREHKIGEKAGEGSRLYIELAYSAFYVVRANSAEIWAPLAYYTALSGSSVATFRDNLSVPSSKVKKSRSVEW
jgi:hypothetical protein